VDALQRVPPPHLTGIGAVVLSVAIHGVALSTWRPFVEEGVSLDAPAYTARLETAAGVVPTAEPAPTPRPRARPKPKTEPRPEETVAFLPDAVEAPAAPVAESTEGGEPQAVDPPATVQESPPPVQPDPVVLAKSADPQNSPASPALRAEALPEEILIRYTLTSAIADGVSEYTWKRDGDRYQISGSAWAEGFVTMFLEGRIEQSASGRITPQGLQPEQFSERRGNTPEEGLVFDWGARTVEFRRGDRVRSAPLNDDTVDWLSMIFQLAHRPPKGEAMDLRVFTQRRMYRYRLEIVGIEELELPFGRASTVHLRHAGEKPSDAVDVWLGVDQHYLPVKLRYPVARNRLVVEQTATAIKAR
jgi:hypothetical protein